MTRFYPISSLGASKKPRERLRTGFNDRLGEIMRCLVSRSSAFVSLLNNRLGGSHLKPLYQQFNICKNIIATNLRLLAPDRRVLPVSFRRSVS